MGVDLMALAERQHQDDLLTARSSTLWTQAVSFLRKWLSPHVQAEVRKAIAREPRTWQSAYHMGWGMGVRNALRNNGFGERHFRVQNLDNIYVELVEEAVHDDEVRATVD